MDPAFDSLIGESRAFRKALRTAELAARTDCPVLISGETGTGKELVARAIHAASCRRSKPLVIVSCPAIPPSLVESELFGHERGAFTGARSTYAGRFGSTHGGTIVLDEIGDLSLQVQAKLLRAIETGDIERLGRSGTVKVDVRVITTTSRDLETCVGSGSFRADLFYRLNVMQVTLAPLRKRGEDIVILAGHFLDLYTEMQRRDTSVFTTDALQFLRSYNWPGNVRELMHSIERAVLVSQNGMIGVRDLGVRIKRSRRLENGRERDLVLIEATLAGNRGNVSAAARDLGLSREGLVYILKKHGIDRHRFKRRRG